MHLITLKNNLGINLAKEVKDLYVRRFIRKLKIELPYDPAIPLLGICPEKTVIRKDTRTPKFTAAVFTIAKTWKQPNCPSTDEWIKKMWYIYIQWNTTQP